MSSARWEPSSSGSWRRITCRRSRRTPSWWRFFDQWVYGTGIPTLKLDYSVKGSGRTLRLAGTIAQSDVDAHFSAVVPVEIQFARGKPVVHWVSAGSEPEAFTVPLKQKPVRVLLDPNRSVLRR